MPAISRVFLAFTLLLSAPAAPALAQQGGGDWLYRGSDIPRDPQWQMGTLPNGVRYAVRRNALPAGQVSIRLRIDAGSLHEAEGEQGWAHFAEHLAFRGSRGFADGQAREIWQKLGASFGSDTNAMTTPTQTVYQLDLPDADASEIDLSLDVIADMMDNALFDPATVAAEQKIILAEKGRRSELATRYLEANRPLFHAGLKFAGRDPIGTDATLRAATAEGLRAFYERWYRPERATVIMVGDADPEAMKAMIARHFGGWRGAGPNPPEPDYGSITQPARRAETLTYPGTPHSATLMWLRPYEALPNTKAREQDDLARSLAARILNRRLEAKARGQAAYVSAGVGESRQTGIADMTQMEITARGGDWKVALTESFAIVADAVRTPPEAAEIARELSNMRTAATSGVEGAATIKSPQWAQQMVNAIDGNSVVASPATSLALLEEFAPRMTPAAVAQATRALFQGAGPRMLLVAPQPIPAPAAEAALAAAQQAAPAVRLAERTVTMADLPAPGAEGREVSRQRIEDMDVTIVRFANGSSLTFKRTEFDKGSVSVKLRFGAGFAGLPNDRPSLSWLDGAVVPSGLGKLDLDALERLLNGRKMSMGFAVEEDKFVLRGMTNGTELGDQLRLLAAKLAAPRWDAAVVERLKTGAIEGYDLAFSSASSRAGREFGQVTHPGDHRWAPVEKAQVAAATPAAFQTFFEPLLAGGPIDAIIVGDVDLETAVAAMRRSIAALPARPRADPPAALLKVAPPAPNPKPATFTHQGDKDQAYAVIGWSTFGGTDRIREQRALALAASMLQVRLFERLRQAEGASYSPSAASAISQTLPDWGIFYVSSALRPESTDLFFRIAREIVADLAANPAAPDEFARAQNPVLSGIERRVKTNPYWLAALDDWTDKLERIEHARGFAADYRALTATDVRDAVARHVAEAGDWSMLVLPGKAAGGGN